MDSKELERALEERGGILRGHFQLASGRHSDTYIEKFRILQWPDLTSALCALIAERFRGEANLVVGPTTGGAIMSFETARQLGLASLIAERGEDDTGRTFKRGFTLGPGDRVLVVDDIMTTGGSIRDVIEAVRERGAAVVGVGVMVDRTGGATDFGVPLFAGLTVTVESYEAAGCELCGRGVKLLVT